VLKTVLILMAALVWSPVAASIHGSRTTPPVTQTFSFLRGSLNGADGGVTFNNLATGTGAMSNDIYAGSASSVTGSSTYDKGNNPNPGFGNGQTWTSLRPWSGINGGTYFPAGIEKDVGFYLNPNNDTNFTPINPNGMPACTTAQVQANWRPCLADINTAPQATSGGPCFPSGCWGILPATSICIRSQATASVVAGGAVIRYYQLSCSSNASPVNLVGLEAVSPSACSPLTGCVAVNGGSYNNSTGVVTLNLASNSYLQVGAPVSVSGAPTGLNGTFQAVSGTNATTAVYNAGSGLGSITIGAWGQPTSGVCVGAVCAPVSSAIYTSSSGLVTLNLASNPGLVVGNSVTVTGANGTGSFSSVNGTPTAGSGTITPGCVAVTSGSYASGVVTLNLASSLGLVPNSPVVVSGATGTGAFATINGPYNAGTGTTGTTLTYTIATGLTMTIGSFGSSTTGVCVTGTTLVYTIASGLTMTVFPFGQSATGVTAGDCVRVLAGGTNAVTVDSVHFGEGPQPWSSCDQQDNTSFFDDTGGSNNLIVENFEANGLAFCTSSPCTDNNGRSNHFRQTFGLGGTNTGSSLFLNGAIIHSDERPIQTSGAGSVTGSTTMQSVYFEGGCDHPWTGGFTSSVPPVTYNVPFGWPDFGQNSAGDSHCEVDEAAAPAGMNYEDVVVWAPRTSTAQWTAAIWCSTGLTRTWISNNCSVNPGVVIASISNNTYAVAGFAVNPTASPIDTMGETIATAGGPVTTVDWENVRIDGTGVGSSDPCIASSEFAVQKVVYTMSGGSMNVSAIGLGVGLYAGLDPIGQQEQMLFGSDTVNITGPTCTGSFSSCLTGPGTYTVSGSFTMPIVFTNTSSVATGSTSIPVSSTTGLVNGMIVTAPGVSGAIPANTVLTISGSNITLSSGGVPVQTTAPIASGSTLNAEFLGATTPSPIASALPTLVSNPAPASTVNSMLSGAQIFLGIPSGGCP
jgi:hypothetical protein